MNCPQCQTPNQQDSAFCSTCGAPLAPAGAAAPASGYSAAGGYGAPGGYGQAGPGAPASQYPPQSQSPAPGYPQPPAGGQYQPRQARAAGPVQFDLQRLTRTDQIVGVATLIAMISIWLPWYSVSLGAGIGSYSFSGTGLHGWLWLEFVVALFLLAYLIMRAGWAEPPLRLPVAHAPVLLVGTGLQLVLLLIAFADIPYGNEGMGWGWAAFIGLLAALAAAGPVVVPAVRSYTESRRQG